MPRLRKRRIPRRTHLGVASALLALACVGLSTASVAMQPMPGKGDASVAGGSSRAPLRVVGLGDSVPAGSACGCAGFVQLAADTLARERGRTAQVANLATGGFTSTDVVEQLLAGTVRRQVISADVVVIEVGANDFDEQRVYDADCTDAPASGCFDPAVSTMASNLTTVVRTVKALDPNGRIVLVGYWNVFRDGKIGAAEGSTYVGASDSLTRWVNTVIHRVATEEGGAYADVYTALKGPDGMADVTVYLADDGDHPNFEGHTVLAAAVVNAVDQ